MPGGRKVLRAENDAFDDGQIGVAGGLKDVRVQPVEPITFDDDFMRVASDVALKDAISNPRPGHQNLRCRHHRKHFGRRFPGSGKRPGWPKTRRPQVAQSANPFAFRPLNRGDNLAVAGRPFWSDVEFAVSAQPQGRARNRSAPGCPGTPKNYLSFSWSAEGDPTLRAVVNGAPRVLGAGQGLRRVREENQWFRLKFASAGGTMRAWIDDVEVARAQTGLFGRGQVGLLTRLDAPGDDKAGVGAVFDDAQVRSTRDFHDDFSSVVPGRWNTVAGKWTWNGAAPTRRRCRRLRRERPERLDGLHRFGRAERAG